MHLVSALSMFPHSPLSGVKLWPFAKELWIKVPTNVMPVALEGLISTRLKSNIRCQHCIVAKVSAKTESSSRTTKKILFVVRLSLEHG
jgi:hypothetical protein